MRERNAGGILPAQTNARDGTASGSNQGAGADMSESTDRPPDRRDDPEPFDQAAEERPRRPNRWDQAGLPRPDFGLILRRIGAWILDQLLVSGVAWLIGLAAGVIGPGVSDIDQGFALWVRALEVVYRWSMQAAVGYTVGKRLLGLRLASEGTARPGALLVLGRELVLFAILSTPALLGLAEQQQFTIVTLLLFLSLWVVFRRRDHRAIHDLPFRTRVVRARAVDKSAPDEGPASFKRY